jgi:hypothetical protein
MTKIISRGLEADSFRSKMKTETKSATKITGLFSGKTISFSDVI